MTDESKPKPIDIPSELCLNYDGSKTLTIHLHTGQTITISDGAQSMALEDRNGNKVLLSPNGIELDSARDIVLKAQGTISLLAGGSISAAAMQDVNVSGMNVKNEAKADFSAKGSATAKLSAGGETTICGAMVMIN